MIFFPQGRFPHMLEVYALYMADDLGSDLDEFEAGLLTWLVQSEFHIEPWSTSKAAKASRLMRIRFTRLSPPSRVRFQTGFKSFTRMEHCTSLQNESFFF